MEQVDNVIGFLELAAWILGVVSVAAAITYVVIRIFPGKDAAQSAGAPAGDEPS
jgi:hypothetical protein